MSLSWQRMLHYVWHYLPNVLVTHSISTYQFDFHSQIFLVGCFANNSWKISFVPEMSMTKQSELHLKLPTGHSSAFSPLLPACWARFTTSILPKAPLLRLFLTHIWPDLVSHSTQNIWGRLCCNDERFHHGRWDLAEDSSYCSSDPSVLMLTSSSLIDGLGCVRDAL